MVLKNAHYRRGVGGAQLLRGEMPERVNWVILGGMWEHIEAVIRETAGNDFVLRSRAAVHGGSINESWRVEGPTEAYFVKLNTASRLPMFEAEAAGLQAMRATGAIRVPGVVALGTAGGCSFLVLEHIELRAVNGAASERLGRELARMHRAQAQRFGWERDNTIGSTPQANRWSPDWPAFYAENRLQYQWQLAAANGARDELIDPGSKLAASVGLFFRDYQPPPSLLHGDLWSGNCGADADSAPVLFDPAVYYGDREADLAMTELFGGFGRPFYAAYDAEWPLDPGYPVRKTLYNLYHVLNHFNLFGGGYHGQAQGMVQALLAEI